MLYISIIVINRSFIIYYFLFFICNWFVYRKDISQSSTAKRPAINTRIPAPPPTSTTALASTTRTRNEYNNNNIKEEPYKRSSNSNNNNNKNENVAAKSKITSINVRKVVNVRQQNKEVSTEEMTIRDVLNKTCRNYANCLILTTLINSFVNNFLKLYFRTLRPS